MYTCLYCNGLKSVEIRCPRCQNSFQDLGKVSDYVEPYSPYGEIDDWKLSDGIVNNYADHLCTHYLFCPDCQYHQIVSFQEEIV